MNAVMFCALLLIGGPLMGFLVIVGACLPGLLAEVFHRPRRQ